MKISLNTEKAVCLTGDDKTVRRVNDKKPRVKRRQNSGKIEAKQPQKGGKTEQKRGILYQTPGRRCLL